MMMDLEYRDVRRHLEDERWIVSHSVFLPEFVQLHLAIDGRLSLRAANFFVTQQTHVYFDHLSFLVKQRQQKVNVDAGPLTALSLPVQPIVPTFNILVGSDGLVVDTPCHWRLQCVVDYNLFQERTPTGSLPWFQSWE